MGKKSLNLQVANGKNGAVIVSWEDPVLAQSQTNMGGVYLFVAGVVVVGCAFMSVSMSSGWPMAVALILSMLLVYAYWTPYMVKKQISISPSKVIFEGQSYPTARVTRFDYGAQSSLTGIIPDQGKGSYDPTVIRMWVDDSEAVILSTNNWQTQVSHKIRAELDRVLQSVRTSTAKAEHVEKYGHQDTEGMPDY